MDLDHHTLLHIVHFPLAPGQGSSGLSRGPRRCTGSSGPDTSNRRASSTGAHVAALHRLVNVCACVVSHQSSVSHLTASLVANSAFAPALEFRTLSYLDGRAAKQPHGIASEGEEVLLSPVPPLPPLPCIHGQLQTRTLDVALQLTLWCSWPLFSSSWSLRSSGVLSFATLSLHNNLFMVPQPTNPTTNPSWRFFWLMACILPCLRLGRCKHIHRRPSWIRRRRTERCRRGIGPGQIVRHIFLCHDPCPLLSYPLLSTPPRPTTPAMPTSYSFFCSRACTHPKLPIFLSFLQV